MNVWPVGQVASVVFFLPLALHRTDATPAPCVYLHPLPLVRHLLETKPTPETKTALSLTLLVAAGCVATRPNPTSCLSLTNLG